MSDGVGQAKLDLGSSSGFLGAGPSRGRWLWAEGGDHGQCDHISGEALHLAWILLSKPHFNGVLFLSPPWRLLGAVTRALLQMKLAAARVQLWRKFLWRVPDGVRSTARAADGGSQPRWTWWRALRRLQRALVSLTETPQHGKLLLKLQSSAISSCPCDFHPPEAMGLRAESSFPQPAP